MIPQNIIDEIRQRCDIVDVVSDYVSLKPSGKHFKALSPFTREKTPSFIVSPDKQIYKCFSSGKGGNIFTFIMEMEKVSFPEAVEMAAGRCGMDISSHLKRTAQSSEDRSEYETLKWAARLFNRLLNSSDGKTGLDYLVTQRGLTQKIITSFGLGYAPDNWEYLLNHAKRSSIPLDQLLKTGLVHHNPKKNSHYDYFRNRVLFPIFTIGGQVAGFGGRTLSHDKKTPKYLNSPESAVFEKSKLLYGLHAAKESIRKQELAILVEGYMDVLALHQAGLDNAVASCGTSLTVYQAKLLHRYTRDVLFIYDGDDAGLKSMLGGIDILVGCGVTPSIAVLPEGEDPDSMVGAAGKNGFLDFIDKNRTSFTDFQIDFFRKKGSFDDPARKSLAIREILRTVSLVSDTVRRELYLQELEQKLGISMAVLRDIVSDTHGSIRLAPKSSKIDKQPEQSTGNPETQQVSVLERTFLKAMLESTWYGNEVLEFCASHEALLRLQNPVAAHILQYLVSRHRENATTHGALIDITTEIGSLPLPAARDLASELLLDQPLSDRWQVSFDEQQQKAKRCLTAFLDSVRALVLSDFRNRKKVLTEKLRTVTDIEQEKQLATDLNTLLREEQATEIELNNMIDTIVQSR